MGVKVMLLSNLTDTSSEYSILKGHKFSAHFGGNMSGLQAPQLAEKESLILANRLLRRTNDYSQLREQYLSIVLNGIAPREVPSEIGLLDVPRLERSHNSSPDRMPFRLNVEDLWRFVSSQVELISSFRLEDGKVVVSNNKRRRGGTYETPSALADALADMILTNFIHTNINEHSGLNENEVHGILKAVSILDPACGTGRLLFSLIGKIETLASKLGWTQSMTDRAALRRDLVRNSIHGIDRDPVAAVAARFLFWYSTLDDGSECIPDIRIGNSLVGRTFKRKEATEQETVDPVPPGDSFNWKSEYPNLDGFNIIITNPPWERLKVMTRESLGDMVSWTLSTRAEIERVLRRKGNGHFRRLLENERELSARQARFFRDCGDYPLSAKGDLNLYALFTERCDSLLTSKGVAGLIVPTGIATDMHLRHLFFSLVDENRLLDFHDFINKKRLFPNVDGRYRYSYLVFSRSPHVASSVRASFYNLSPETIDGSSFPLTKDQIKTFNPLTCTLVVPKSPAVIPLLTRIHKTMPFLCAGNGDSWGIRYKREADMTNDSHLFTSTQNMIFDRKDLGILRAGNKRYLRVYEGKMVDRYNHRAGSSTTKTGLYRRSGHPVRPTLPELMDPHFLVKSRYAVSENELLSNTRLKGNLKAWHLVFKDITAATNRRTVRAAIVPASVVSNKLPTLAAKSVKDEACLLATLNSAVFDFIARQKIGNITLNWYMLRQMPVPPLASFRDGTVDGKRISDWVVNRVRRLTFTSYDLEKWSQAVGGPSRPFLWRVSEREKLEAEIDSLMFHMYRLSPKEARMVLSEFPQIDAGMVLDRYSQIDVNIP